MRRIFEVGALLSALGLVGCGPSVSALTARGDFVKACNRTDFTYERVLADALAKQSGVVITITPRSADETLKKADLPTPARDPSWMSLSVDLSMAKSQTPVAEVSMGAPQIRADGWFSRVVGALGGSYLLLTGKSLPPARRPLSVQDFATWARELATTGKSSAADRIAEAYTPNETPDDVIGAQRLNALFPIGCIVSPGTRDNTASLLVKDAQSHPGKPAAVGLTVRYAVRDPASGSLCNQVEHMVIPLAPGKDLPAQLAATFPPGASREVSLIDLRSRARVYGSEAEDPFYEDNR